MNMEDNFVITFSGDGTPIQLPPISLLLDGVTGDLSNNARVILGRAFGDFLNDELSQEWADNTEIADLTSVLVDVIKLETVASKPGGLKEIEATLDTTLTFDGLADAPDPTTVNEAVFKALAKMQQFLDNYLIPSGLTEFESVTSASATMAVAATVDKEKPAKKEDDDKPKKDDKKPAVAQANAFRSVSFDPQDLKILVPALVGGLAMFMLTAFWLARHRRRDQLDVSYDSYDEDIDHTVNGSQIGKEEIEVQPANLMDYGYSPDGHVDLNSSYGAGHVAMHIPAMDQSMASGYNVNNRNSTPPRTKTAAQKYNGRSVIDSPSKASSADTSEYSEGRYWR